MWNVRRLLEDLLNRSIELNHEKMNICKKDHRLVKITALSEYNSLALALYIVDEHPYQPEQVIRNKFEKNWMDHQIPHRRRWMNNNVVLQQNKKQ